MNIKLLDSWIREYIETNATPTQLAQTLSLCGPSFERIDAVKVLGKKDYVYDIEVTTNRVDMMSVIGIAREASVILPEFGFIAKLKKPELASLKQTSVNLPININTDPKLTNRVMGVVLDNIANWETPEWMVQKLAASGFRSLGAPIDITNYVMTEIGHPTHVFDYDLVKTHTFKIRESKSNEKIVSLDGKQYSLPGGDIVIDDGTGTLIDLPGIIGAKNSVVNKDTKRILFFMEANDHVKIRKTSMTLGIRTVAATLNEKGVDPELAEVALKRGVFLFEKICKAKVASKVTDLYTKKIKPNTIIVEHPFIERILGVEISPKRVLTILNSLGFATVHSTSKNSYSVVTPSWRTQDVTIPEDVVEEIARIYGYHNLPSVLMTGSLPEKRTDSTFEFEKKIKQTLKSVGGIEIYTYSMVSKEMAGVGAMEIKNPLGSDTAYLRKSLAPSLLQAAKSNAREKESFHLFEMAHVYLPRKADLPEEKLVLAGIIANSDIREVKGVLEALFEDIHAETSFSLKKDGIIEITSDSKKIGELKKINKFYYYELPMESLYGYSSVTPTYQPIPKNPAQIEDTTIEFPEMTIYADVKKTIISTDKKVANVELVDIFNNSYTFRIWYQAEDKTLTDDEVEKIRSEIIKNVEKKHSGRVK